MKQKGFIPIVIILLIALAVGGYFIYTNQQKPVPVPQQITQPSPTSSDETADWKTHVSKNYGYELKYLPDWNWKDSGLMGESLGKNFVKNSDDYSCSLTISVINTSNFGNLMTQNRATQKQNSVNIETSKMNNENNISIIKDESPDSIKARGIYASYYIKNEKGKFSYQIYANINKNIINEDGYRVVYGTVNDQNCLDIFDQILSTFKFTQ